MIAATPMSPAGGIGASLAYLAAIVAAGGGEVVMPDSTARELSAAADAWRPVPAPIGMVALPCALSAARWHLEQLLSTAAHDATMRAKRLLHARFLGYLLSPDQSQFRPLVTILIPVHDRAALCAEAVQSCLAQTWRPIEILVVDDGSTDDLASTLLPYGDAVRLLHKPNGGVSSARNMGIAAACGDFIHFLDSDNLLLLDAIAAKVEAFAAVADADLCYGVALIRGANGKAHLSNHVPDGSRQCPTRNLMAAVARAYPFFVSTVMMARWAARDGVAFEEDLRSAEDLRYWAALARRGTKVIGFWRPLMVRRTHPKSLGGRHSPFPDSRVIARLRNLRDTLVHREHWQHAGGFHNQILSRHVIDPITIELTGAVKQTVDELLTAVDQLADGDRWAGHSALPVLADLRAQYRWHMRDRRISSRQDAGSRLLADLDRAVSNAMARAPGLTPQDVAFWLAGEGRSPDGTIRQFLAALGPWKRGARRKCAEANAILRHLPYVPSARDVARYRGVRRWFGATVARAVLRIFPVTRPATAEPRPR
ncbi:MAG TPA: glycosyltransferase [Dongiaceae bacterium]|nr:glycosyltransferase [Dongiaceae bacterium]